MSTHRPMPVGHENVTYKEHLELRYLRWDYLIKVSNPNDALLKSKEKIVKYAARRMFFRHAYEFSFMGMTLEDVESIARVYTVSYLGLYSMYADEAKRIRFIKKFKKENEGKEPSKADYKKKDEYSLIYFLEQRLLECANILRQYCRGEAGFSHYSVFKRVSGDLWPSDDDLIQSPRKYGWKRLNWQDFAQIRDMFASIVPGYSLELKGEVYRVASPTTSMHHSDLAIGDLMDTVDNSPMNPEELMTDMEETSTRKVNVKGVIFNISRSERITSLVELYKQRTLEQQYRILGRLIKWLQRRNGFQKEMQQEIDQVRKMQYNVNKKILSKKERDEQP